MNTNSSIAFCCACALVSVLAILYAMFSFAAYADTQASRERLRQQSIAKCDKKGHKGFYIDERGEVWCTL